MHQYLSETYGDSLAEDILRVKAEQVNRQREIAQLTPAMKGVLGRVQVGMTRVSADEISYYMNQEDCEEIFYLVKSDFEDEFTDDASSRFRENRQPVVDYADRLLEETKEKLFEDRYEQVRKLEES